MAIIPSMKEGAEMANLVVSRRRRACTHHLTVVTRSQADFHQTGVTVLNPFTA